jgi:Uma2 family endonuclease
MSRPIARDDELMTLETVLALPEEDEYRLELTRGQLVREPAPTSYHARIQVRLTVALSAYEEASQAGMAFTNAGFILPLASPTVRVPDLAFVRNERISAGGYPKTMWRIAPDLAIEILSPSNRPRDVQEKIVDYLEAGVRLIWIIDPATRTARIHRPDQDQVSLLEGEKLLGGDVLPGLTVPLEGLFRP